MRYLFVLGVFFLWTLNGFAQGDIPTTKPLKIKGNLGVKKAENKGTALKIPSVLDKKSSVSLNTKKEINMLPEKKLVQAGHDLELDAKIGEKEKKGSKKHFGDMYLGDIKTSSKFVGVVCRDHEFVDGDRVKIYSNDIVVEPNILLTGAFKGVNINLQKGFNRIDFEALNQGSSGPNTAQIDVYDEKGQLIYSNRWNLSTGSKASLIVVKDE